MRNFKAKLLGLSLLVVALSACNRGFDKVVPGSPTEPIDKQVFKTPKVLYIIADGARGTQVRDANIPTLKSLLPHAIYSWNSLSDATQATNATNWADMITGVKKEKHNVLTDDFAGNNLTTYKTVFERIKSINPNMRMASFASNVAFKNNLTAGTNVSEQLANDEAVKTRMVDFVKTDAADLIVGEFSGIQTAGLAGKFDNSDAGYKNAIGAFDTQVGAILASVQSRATFKSENWLVIISSNKGGAFTLNSSEDDKTVFSNTDANTFTIIYNESYNPTFIAKPFVGNSYSGNAVRFRGWPHKGVAEVRGATNAESATLSSVFNFGDTSSFTISVKIKKRRNPYNTSRGNYYYQWPGFLGKQGTTTNSAANVWNTPTTNWNGSGGRGWNFCLFQNRWRFMVIGNKDGTGLTDEIAGMEFSGDTWHDLTAVVERTSTGAKQVRLYTDGIPGITNRGTGSLASPMATAFTLGANPNFDNNSVLRLGWTPGEQQDGEQINGFGHIDVELKEFKIFKAALPDAVVRQYACDQTIDRSHPYFNFLVGYWPIDEGGTSTVLRDRVGVANMTMSQQQSNTPATGTTTPLFSGYQWTAFTDLICSPAATNLGLLVPKNSDIPAQILSWFNIARQATWALDGKVWIAN